MNKPRIFILEGLPGCGKTTFKRSARDYLASRGWTVHEMEEEIDGAFLDAFIADQPRYAFAFQISFGAQRRYAWLRALDIVAADPSAVVLIDRSRIGDLAFALMHEEAGNIGAAEMRYYCGVAGVGVYPGLKLASLHPPQHCSVLYLEVTPKKTLERICSRGRESEASGYTEKYMSDLQRHYDAVVERSGASVRRLDWNEDVELRRSGNGEWFLPDSKLAPIFDAALPAK